MKCKNCGKETEQIKAGKTRALRQKYKCKHCGKVYTPSPKERSYSEEIKKQAIKYYLEGMDFRRIENLMHVSHVSAINRLKKSVKVS